MTKTLNLFRAVPPLLFLCITAFSQTPVTAVFSHRVSATTSKSYTGTGATGHAGSGLTGNSYTYKFGTNVATSNNLLKLDSFTALGLNYHMQATTAVKFRRSGNPYSTSGVRKSLWFELTNGATVSAGGTCSFLADYDDSLERIFSTGYILSIGIDNDFQNDSATNNNNIERVDCIISSGVKATDVTKAGFAIFDRGAGGGHDPFYIAAIRTLDASGNPSSYYSPVSVGATNYGNNVVGNFNYIILRENPSETGLLMMNNTTNQNRDGVLIRFTDLGVANNTTIYGYSLFGPDVNTASTLVDYTNSTNFPTNTNLSGGGLDQVAISGLWVTNASYVVLSQQVENFSAQTSDGHVQLTWALGNTDGLASLIIERSPDGIAYMPWESILRPSPGVHGMTDTQPLPGKSFYRLRLVNNDDESVAYSPMRSVIAVPLTGLNDEWSVYPNPAVNKKITLRGTGLMYGSYELSCFNAAGLLMAYWDLKTGGSTSRELNFPSPLLPGGYTVVLADNRGKRIFSKMILIR